MRIEFTCRDRFSTRFVFDFNEHEVRECSISMEDGYVEYPIPDDLSPLIGADAACEVVRMQNDPDVLAKYLAMDEIEFVAGDMLVYE